MTTKPSGDNPSDTSAANAGTTAILDITSSTVNVATMDGEPFPNATAKRMILAVLASGVLSFSGHAIEEMANDKLDESDVRNVLRGGVCRFTENRGNTWRYRFETDKIAVVVAFRTVKNAIVVTVFKLKRK